MHHGRPLAEAAAVGEELDRAPAVLGEALLDLARLLVGVDVEHEPLVGGVAAELLQPVPRAGADGVGGDPDREARAPQTLDLGEVGGDGRLAHALEPTARVGDVEADELEPGLRGGGGGREGRLDPEVVELPDGGEAGGAHLAVGAPVELRDGRGRLALRLREHRLAPRPEVAARCASPERPLERVAVDVDEPGEHGCSRHGRRQDGRSEIGAIGAVTTSRRRTYVPCRPSGLGGSRSRRGARSGAAVLGEALLDLARLLVGVDVEHEPFVGGVAAELLEPLPRAGADGVGGDPDRETASRSRSTSPR